MKRVVLFGDSLLAQLRKPLITQLEQDIGGEAIVYNCAAAGWDSDDGVTRAERIARIAPDIVVLSFGANDCAPWKRVEPRRFAANIRTIIDSFAPAAPVGFLVPDVIEDPASRPDYRRNDDIELYRRLMREALPAGCATEPSRVLNNAGLTPREAHKPDGLHLTEAAYRPLMADLARVISAL